MQHATLVCLDLDDTLWDLPPVIARAEQDFHAWLQARYPLVAERHSVASIRALRDAVTRERPGAHDIAALRRETYRRLAAEAGYPAAMADEAFAVFQGLRNRVTLYADVLPALRRLAALRPLVAMTNGNADLAAIGIRAFFRTVITAAGVGVAKPDPDFFLRGCRSLGVSPGELVYAGNDPEHDIVAPRALGISTVWVNRAGADWPADRPPPLHEVRDLHGLAALFDA